MDSFSLLFTKPIELEYLNQRFDFNISPNHFIEWLKLEGEKVTGDYKMDVSSMCEYSCLYICMMLHDKPLIGDMRVYCGQFGFWGHWWIGYKVNGCEYFIDLTLQQFNPLAPKLAITKAMNERVSGGYSYLSDGVTMNDYIEENRAFMFYANPQTMQPPPISFLR